MKQEQWQSLSKRTQLATIGAELLRALHWQNADQEKKRSALTRALVLIDLSLNDPRWRDNFSMLRALQETIIQCHLGTNKEEESLQIIYRAL